MKRIPISLSESEYNALKQFQNATDQRSQAGAVYMLFKRGLSAWIKENPLRKIAVQESIDL